VDGTDRFGLADGIAISYTEDTRLEGDGAICLLNVAKHSSDLSDNAINSHREGV
jgi:hypothetical protein